MNRSELVQAVATGAGVDRSVADAVLKSLPDVIGKALAEGDKVSWPGFLTLERTERSARTGRNPRTGEPIEIPAATTVKVSAGATLKGAVK